MANWKLICDNGWWKLIADECYTSPYFPIEVRGLLASWLEAPGQERTWLLDERTQQPHIYGFVQNMIGELVQRTASLPATTPQEYVYKYRFDDISKQMQIQNHLEIFKQMKQSMASEQKVISRLQNGNNSNNSNIATASGSDSYGKSSPQKSFTQLNTEMTAILHNLTVAVKGAENRVHQCHTVCYNLQSQLTPIMQRLGQNGMDLNNSYEYQTELSRIKAEAAVKVREVYPLTLQLIPELGKAYTTSAQEVESFKEEQRLFALGKKPERELDKIDKWYAELTECFISLQPTLKVLLDLCGHFCFELVKDLQPAIDKVEAIRMDMISSCLVIETQPPQVIRTKTRFAGQLPVKLRVLSCSKNMMVERRPIVNILINDVQARGLEEKKLLDPNYIPDPMGTLTMAKGYPRADSHAVQFKDFKVNEPTRGTRKGEKMVAEEPFHIFLQITVNIDGTPHTLWTKTLPIIITTHPTQEAAAWATILWYNALSNQKQEPFSKVPVPQDVSWTRLIDLIDLLFLKAGKRLSEDNKIYLKNKLFRGTPQNRDMVSYNLFCKDDFAIINIKLLSKKKKVVKSEIVPGLDGQDSKKFTFWMWVWSFLDLLNWTPEDPTMADYSLKHLWNQNKILGFMSADEITNQLNNACGQYPNTHPFLLRFPEGRPESIGLYFLGGTAAGTKELIKFTYLEEDLDKISLHERIRKNIALSHLLPGNIEKDEAFKKSSRESSINRYFIVGLQEYWPSSLFRDLQSATLNQNVPSPSTSTSHSHSYGSYHSQSQNHSSQVPSPSPSTHSDHSSSYVANYGTGSPGSCSTAPLTTDHLAFHELFMETCDPEFLIPNWVQDGVTTSSLQF